MRSAHTLCRLWGSQFLPSLRSRRGTEIGQSPASSSTTTSARTRRTSGLSRLWCVTCFYPPQVLKCLAFQVAGLWVLDTTHQILISHASMPALVCEVVPGTPFICLQLTPT
jgi:hypothetical protein